MSIYRRAWRATWLVIGTIPVVLGFLEASPAALFVLGTSVAVMLAAVGQPIRTRFLAGLLGAPMVAGLWSTGAVGFGLLMLALVTAPCVVARVGTARHRRRRPGQRAGLTSEAAGVVAMPVLNADLWAGPVHALEDQQLCSSWSESFVALKLARTLNERLELVNLRQAYLDEFESRNPLKFDSWLRAGAWPVGSAHSILGVSKPRRQPPQDPVTDQPIEEPGAIDPPGGLSNPPSDPGVERGEGG